MADLNDTVQLGDLETLWLKINLLQEQIHPGVQKQEQSNHILKEDYEIGHG